MVFLWEHLDGDGASWRAELAFSVETGRPCIHADYRIACDRDREVLRFDGPMLYVLKRDEAVFPGLEWLVDDEVSSSTLDIKAGHPHQVRYVPHPNMVTIPAIGIHGEAGTVGLLWDIHQKWDGVHDRPAVVFASPDRFNHQRSHLIGLQLPSVPQFLEFNEREAKTPYLLRAGQELAIQCELFVDGTARDALAALDEWFETYGWPEPAPLPHGSYEEEIAFSMRAYLESLWDEETKQWWFTKRGPSLLSYKTRHPLFVADLLFGAVVSPDPELHAACRARAGEMAALLGREPRMDALMFGKRADLTMADSTHVATLLGARTGDRLWRFDADFEDTAIFAGYDYHELGPDNAVEVGMCAAKTHAVLRYARIAGDWAAYEAVENVLEYMERFRVPRAAQVWEVPVHTPDVLAAADAVDAYLEAYRFTGNERWLRDAVTWARRGLPFIYFWEDPEKPYVLGGSIPVFGASWLEHSWFGRPVQWNGLRYANALLSLAEYDASYPWRHIAELIVRSAIHQQEAEGEDVALWPDSISVIDGSRSPWVFPPRQIIQSIRRLTGRDEDPRTVILGEGRSRIHISAVAAITDASRKGESVRFTLTYPTGEQGVALVSNVAGPHAVYLDGNLIAERPGVEQGPEPGWRYDPGRAFLSVRIPKDGQTHVRLDGVQFRYVERLPQPTAKIHFEFDETIEGWTGINDIADLSVENGELIGKITGPDPYLVRTGLIVPPNTYRGVVVRMRVNGGATGQFYWTTPENPHFAEERVLRFDVVTDGAFHEYHLPLYPHPQWADHTITGIRIDPGNGILEGDFAIDYVRGVPVK